MQLLYKPMGIYQTNCYIVSNKDEQIIIDPGVGATDWVIKNVKNPVAILNTHGHFDHVWSNSELKQKLNVPIYCPKDDAFMLENDPFGQGTPPSKADVLVEGDATYKIGGFEVKFLHFPGHTPGCSSIEIEDAFFSGDFIFKGSIGRVDFPYSNPSDMKKSIKKFLDIPYDKVVYCGHGDKTTIKEEQKRLPMWLEYL